MAHINAMKIKGDWPADAITPPCSPPPKITPLEKDDEDFEDMVPWMSPPNFCLYWCGRDGKSLGERWEDLMY